MSVSKEQHWWPVGLQRYWADTSGDVSCIDPKGNVESKRVNNRNIGKKLHGHTIKLPAPWKHNFEPEFDGVDNPVHDVVRVLQDMKPFDRGRQAFEVCKHYPMEIDFQRKLLGLLLSLLVRSPAYRARCTSAPKAYGLQSDDNVGKANMLQTWRRTKEILARDYMQNCFVLLLHSPKREFHFGDGMRDSLTNSLLLGQLRGRAVVPVTPNLCAYLSTPRGIRDGRRIGSIRSAKWAVDQINDYAQVYSERHIFFRGETPKVSQAFEQGTFLEYASPTDNLIDYLDDVVLNSSQSESRSAARA